MKTTIYTALRAKALLLVVNLITSLFGQAQSQPVLQPADLNLLQGTWTGDLTYLDYTSGKQVTINAIIYGWRKNNNSRVWHVKYEYPNEPGYTSSDTYQVSHNGAMLGGRKVVENSSVGDGMLKLVLEEKGKDDNQPATLRYTMLLSAHKLTITKMVRYEGTADFFRRSEYNMSR